MRKQQKRSKKALSSIYQYARSNKQSEKRVMISMSKIKKADSLKPYLNTVQLHQKHLREMCT